MRHLDLAARVRVVVVIGFLLAILGFVCETVTGHRLGAWERYDVPESEYGRFEIARCRICRQGFVRPQPLT